MDSYDLIPHLGVGEIRFGMSRAEVEARLGKPERAMPPDPFVGDTVLFYEGSALAISVDHEDRICSIESRGCDLLLDGRNLRLESWASLKELLAERDPDLSLEEGGLSLTSRGLGLAANTADEASPQGLLAFRRGYFERPRRGKVDQASRLAAMAAAIRRGDR